MCEKFFTPPLQNLVGETTNFAELPPTHRQSEARNLETAQHIDKQKPDVTPTINALKGTKLGHHPTGF